MKRIVLFFLLTGSLNLFSQISQGDITIAQQIYGIEKAALVQEYMAFTPHQDSVFWPIYENYERERQEICKQRISLVEEYLNNIEDITADKATELVSKSTKLEISFKKLQKKYNKQISKKIGSVKASQFYQFENYLNNVINITIQENIPFVGSLHQKYSEKNSKK